MKKTFACALLYALCILLLPLTGLLRPAAARADSRPDADASAPAGDSAKDSSGDSAPASLPDPQGDLLIWDSGAKELLTVPIRDYLIGAVASEMPPTWPDEALKAQAVACHSYALYQQQKAGPDAAVTGYFSADPARRQGFMTDEVLRSYWGSAYDENYARISALVDSVLNQVLTWEGQPAAACYHAISCGSTESSQNVWKEALPYLQGVDSPLDLTSPDFEKSVTYTAQQMLDALTLNGSGVDLTDIPQQDWFGASTRTGAGYVDTIQVGGTPISGAQLRQILGLRSACFEIAYEDGVFTVTTRGYGHGVGLSQYGANALALTGKCCQEILAFYYPGTVLETF